MPVGSTITDQHLARKVSFADGDDVTLADANFVTDGVGLNGEGRIHVRLTGQAIAIGADFPGAMTLELWDRQGGTLLYTSSDFAGGGTGFFGGVVSGAPFTFVVIRDWVDDKVYIDNLYVRFQNTVYLPIVMR